jgi:hypothetical protein
MASITALTKDKRQSDQSIIQSHAPKESRESIFSLKTTMGRATEQKEIEHEFVDHYIMVFQS